MIYPFISVAIGMIVILGSEYYSPKAKKAIAALVIALSLVCAFLHIQQPGGGYYRMVSGATLMLMAFLWANSLSRSERAERREKVKFVCPFCSQAVEFSPTKEGSVAKCPSCRELVQVTEDQEVRKAAKAEHDALMQAIEGEEEIPLDESSVPLASSIDPIFGSSGRVTGNGVLDEDRPD